MGGYRQGLAYLQLAVALKSTMQGSGSAAMGGYRQAVVALENNELLVAAVGFH